MEWMPGSVLEAPSGNWASEKNVLLLVEHLKNFSLPYLEARNHPSQNRNLEGIRNNTVWNVP